MKFTDKALTDSSPDSAEQAVYTSASAIGVLRASTCGHAEEFKALRCSNGSGERKRLKAINERTH
ncbi:hypothetical protein PILCRDRAFT_821038 [Piloderma croceum F 1598]|uniref:Uncharacterized protein n=1 Tax=Piloderma croceum (strain F 1598) TaxID=765440 RepID=A0A0C3FPQ2_PILCF|nr:hypothetical protein PILCRDRAFT_821038 [Piloderma croceum F 1598]